MKRRKFLTSLAALLAVPLLPSLPKFRGRANGDIKFKLSVDAKEASASLQRLTDSLQRFQENALSASKPDRNEMGADLDRCKARFAEMGIIFE